MKRWRVEAQVYDRTNRCQRRHAIDDIQAASPTGAQAIFEVQLQHDWEVVSFTSIFEMETETDPTMCDVMLRETRQIHPPRKRTVLEFEGEEHELT